MGCKWQHASLGDICRLVGGSAFPRRYQGQSEGVPFIKVSDMNLSSNGWMICKASNHVNEKVLVDIGAKKHPRGATVFAKIGEALKADRTRMLTTETAIDNNMMAAIPKSGTDKWFLYYLISWLRLSNYAEGSALPYLKQSTLNKIPITLPNSEVAQRKVVEILYELDSQIKLNTAQNGYLTALRNAVVQTKISEEIDYEPSEWHQVLLPDIADLQSGYSYKSAELRDSSDTGMVSIKNFSRDGSFKTSGFKPIEPEKAKPAQWVNVGDVVVAHTDLTQNADIIGRAIQVLDDGGYQKLIASLDLVKVVSKNEHIPNELLAALLGTEDFHRHCLTYVNGTTVLHLSKKALKDYAVWLPNDKRALESLSHLFVAIAHHQVALLKESRALTQLRDALLPKLMSGEIDVSKVEVPMPPNSHLSGR